MSLSAHKLRGRLLSVIPSERCRPLGENSNPPKIGDIVGLDQGFTGKDGKPMTLAYGFDDSDEAAFEVELYDSDFEPVNGD